MPAHLPTGGDVSVMADVEGSPSCLPHNNPYSQAQVKQQQLNFLFGKLEAVEGWHAADARWVPTHHQNLLGSLGFKTLTVNIVPPPTASLPPPATPPQSALELLAMAKHYPVAANPMCLQCMLKYSGTFGRIHQHPRQNGMCAPVSPWRLATIICFVLAF